MYGNDQFQTWNGWTMWDGKRIQLSVVVIHKRDDLLANCAVIRPIYVMIQITFINRTHDNRFRFNFSFYCRQLCWMRRVMLLQWICRIRCDVFIREALMGFHPNLNDYALNHLYLLVEIDQIITSNGTFVEMWVVPQKTRNVIKFDEILKIFEN